MHWIRIRQLRLARISSTRLTLPSLPPDEMLLSVRVPMRMSVWGMSFQVPGATYRYAWGTHRVDRTVTFANGLERSTTSSDLHIPSSRRPKVPRCSCRIRCNGSASRRQRGPATYWSYDRSALTVPHAHLPCIRVRSSPGLADTRRSAVRRTAPAIPWGSGRLHSGTRRSERGEPWLGFGLTVCHGVQRVCGSDLV